MIDFRSGLIIINPRSKFPQRGSKHYSKTLVREGASIGANVTIVGGNTIGKNAFIGAGATIISNVLDYALIVGSPGRQIGWVCECGQKLDDKLVCNKCNKIFIKTSSGINEKK